MDDSPVDLAGPGLDQMSPIHNLYSVYFPNLYTVCNTIERVRDSRDYKLRVESAQSSSTSEKPEKGHI